MQRLQPTDCYFAVYGGIANPTLSRRSGALKLKAALIAWVNVGIRVW